VLRPDVWGEGFATEAGRACLDWGFRDLGLPYVTAMILLDNQRSIRVAERLGMTPLRSDSLMELPVVVYAIERPEGSEPRAQS
jgi:RimJ/RimL family protein N-acetyltransferase